MLSNIIIENVALIRRIEVEFARGFSVLTGETAAGKSIIIDSINMALGGRVSRELIRSGQEKAAVRAVFFDNNSGEPFQDGMLVISREVYADGRNVCKINDEFVSVSALKDVTSQLINIHGQHDSAALLNSAKHIEFLDRFAPEIIAIKHTYRQTFDRVRELETWLDELTSNQTEKAQRIDMLQFQLEEINKVNPVIGEDESLNSERDILANSEKIADALNRSYAALFQDDDETTAVDLLARAEDSFGKINEINTDFQEIYDRIVSARIEVDDISHRICDFINKIDHNPARLDEVERRLHELYVLRRKYGAEISDVLKYKTKIEEELGNLNLSDEQIFELNADLANAKMELEKQAEILTKKRKQAAKILQEQIMKELADLEMAKTQFVVQISSTEPTANGADKVEFLISTNVGESLKPLAKIASGGELSRIMLAIKSILADTDGIETLIFDEIDTGISGRTAGKVAQKLAKIGQTKQILAITHLAQIASYANAHYKIEKQTDENTTETHLIKLNQTGRQEELARIISGEVITDITLENAREMLEMGGNV